MKEGGKKRKEGTRGTKMLKGFLQGRPQLGWWFRVEGALGGSELRPEVSRRYLGNVWGRWWGWVG